MQQLPEKPPPSDIRNARDNDPMRWAEGCLAWIILIFVFLTASRYREPLDSAFTAVVNVLADYARLPHI